MKSVGILTIMTMTVAAFMGCSSTPDSVLASSYDQSCATDDDCATITELTSNDTGCTEGCPSATINRRDVEKYKSDFESTKKECLENGSYGQPGCAVGAKPKCEASRCVSR